MASKRGGLADLSPPEQDRGREQTQTGWLRAKSPKNEARSAAAADTPGYVPLWCKSYFSFLEGASSPQELVETAGSLGLPAIAISDRSGMYGVVRAWAAARELGQRLVLGAEASLASGGSVVLLAETREGYANICTLLTRGLMRSPKGESAVRIDEVCDKPGGILVLWPNAGMAAADQERALRLLREAFPKSLYLAVSRHHRIDDERNERRTRELGVLLDLPLVAANEVLYHLPARRKTRDVLTCIKHGVSLDSAGSLLLQNGTHSLLPPAAMARLFADSPELLERTLEIADRCTFSMAEIRYRYPQERVPTGFTTDEWLGKLCEEGARWRYDGNVPAAVSAQLEKELSIISRLEYAGYFLTMYEIVQYCKSRNILCQGRGSAANSAVCYCLGITAIDPVRMDLLFERFLSVERAEPPDIDLDIEHQRREEVIQHMYEHYGRDRAAMVANLVRYRPRSAIRDVGKAFGFTEITLDRIARRAPHWGHAEVAAIIRETLDDSHPRVANFIGQVLEILDFPRHLSIHPGGFLLGSELITRIVPTENATMPGRTVIQWDKDDIETLGLFKVDLLGLGALTHMRKSFALIEKHYGRTLSIATIPPDDGLTYRMLQRGDTVGVFQIESRAQMAMLPRIKPANYYDIVVEIALIRPGPITGDMVHPYLRRRSGTEPVDYPHPSLEPVLKKTLGIPLFQEQVMKIATVAADYTPGEADQLRRDMAAWKQAGRLERHEDKIISRMIAKGIQREFAERIFAQMKGFGEYGFPESHSASFATIAYASAYVRAHYPAAFSCGLLNSLPMGFYSASSIVEDARRHGVRFLPPDVLASSWDCELEIAGGSNADSKSAADSKAAADSKSAAGSARAAIASQLNIGSALPQQAPLAGKSPAGQQRTGKSADARSSGTTSSAKPRLAIRLGMRFLRGLARADWDRIEAARAAGNLRSIGDLRALGLPRDTLEILAESGALECFGFKRRTALWAILDRMEPQPARGELLPYQEGAARFLRLSPAEEVQWDYRSSSLSSMGHILETLRPQLREAGLPSAAHVNFQPDKTLVRYAGSVICRQRPGNAGGVVFMTMEDETGFVNLVVWEKVFEEHKSTILTNWFLGVTGRMQVEEGVHHLIADSFWVPDLGRLPTEKIESRNFH